MVEELGMSRNILLALYEFILALSGLLVLLFLWSNGFVLDTVFRVMGIWLIFAIVFYLPTVRSKIVP